MSSIDYDSLVIDGLREVFLQISKSCISLDIDFFIVGAIARNIWYVANDQNPKGTKDIDFGIYVASEKQYNKLRSILITKYNYVQSSENGFCLITPDGKQIGLLPFGDIEKNDQVLIEGKGLTRINLDGFEEVFKLGATDITIGKEQYKSCSIAGIMILKLIAFDDRPDQRTKDIQDISSICKHYPSIEMESIFSNHFDLYDDILDHDEVGIIVLGREMRRLTDRNEVLVERINNILDKSITDENSLLELMIENPETETIIMKKKIIQLLKQGFVNGKVNQ